MWPRSKMADKNQERSRDNGQPKPYKPSIFANLFHGFYERFRSVPLLAFDIFIGLCVAAIVVIIAVSFLHSRGIL